MTLGTASEAGAYCAPVFYVWEQSRGIFIIKSSRSSRHFREAVASPFVAGSILPDIMEISRIYGLQFTGSCSDMEGLPEFGELENLYHRTYPEGRSIEGNFLIVNPSYFKLTDNRLGFGAKIIWKEKK